MHTPLNPLITLSNTMDQLIVRVQLIKLIVPRMKENSALNEQEVNHKILDSLKINNN